MRLAGAFLFLIAATLSYAAIESKISTKVIDTVEGMVNDKFRATTADPYDLLGTARCTYLDGYGALISVELELVYLQPMTPFRRPYSPEEIAAIHDRKIKKLPALKETMRTLLASSAVALDSIPTNQRVALEARLWNYRWEDTKGLPRHILMSAEKSKLLDAHGNPAALAAVIEEQEQ